MGREGCVCEIDTGGKRPQLSALLGGLGQGSGPAWASISSSATWGVGWAWG